MPSQCEREWGCASDRGSDCLFRSNWMGYGVCTDWVEVREIWVEVHSSDYLSAHGLEVSHHDVMHVYTVKVSFCIRAGLEVFVVAHEVVLFQW